MAERLKVPIHLGGVAVVHCPHDREKGVLRDPDDALKLGAEMGLTFDPATQKWMLCACCGNVFVTTDDEPRLCDPCNGIPVSQLVGILPLPTGVIA